MAVGIDDVADRLVGAGADGREQLPPSRTLPPVSITATASFADDEADIGDRAFVLARHQRDFAGMHEYSGRDFAHRQFLLLVPAIGSMCRTPRAERTIARAMSHVSASVSPGSDIDRFVFSVKPVCAATRNANPPRGLFLLHAMAPGIAFDGGRDRSRGDRDDELMRRRRCLLLPLVAIAAVLAGRRHCPGAQTNDSARSVDRTGRSQGAAGLRRSAQFAVLEREGRGVREQARRAVCGKAAEEARLHVLPAGDRLRPDDARRASLRRHHGLSARRRSRPGHQSLLPHGLCAGRQAGQRP